MGTAALDYLPSVFLNIICSGVIRNVKQFYLQYYPSFENNVLRKIFGPKRDDQTDEWRRLHNGELHDLYGKPDIIRNSH